MRRWRELPPACPGSDVLDILGQQFAVEADGGETEREETGKRAETEQLDEEDREDDLGEGARHGDHGAAERGRLSQRRQVTGCAQADGYGQGSMPMTVDVTVIHRLS